MDQKLMPDVLYVEFQTDPKSDIYDACPDPNHLAVTGEEIIAFKYVLEKQVTIRSTTTVIE